MARLDMTVDRCEKYARELGEERGRNAAAWWDQDAIGGRAQAGTERQTAMRVLAMLEEGDPAIYDSLPQPDLSGEWAGDMTGPELVQDAMADAGVDLDRHKKIAEHIETYCFLDICDHYETAFRDACEREIVAVCKAAAEGDAQ